MARKGGWR
jgi:hypothetical protein